MKSLLSSRPVLWFLFLFNAAVATAAAVAGRTCISTATSSRAASRS
jgi:hypothetical protein